MSGQKPLCESVVLDCERKASHFCSKILALFTLMFVAKSDAYDRQWWKAVVAAGRIHRGQLRRKQKLRPSSRRRPVSRSTLRLSKRSQFKLQSLVTALPFWASVWSAGPLISTAASCAANDTSVAIGKGCPRLLGMSDPVQQGHGVRDVRPRRSAARCPLRRLSLWRHGRRQHKLQLLVQAVLPHRVWCGLRPSRS
jgi:hypothetical protein